MDRIARFAGHPLVARAVDGEAIAADMPLSFWGGFDPDTGRIIDQRHPLVGRFITGRILVIPAGRGSCSGSGVLLEAIRAGTAPAGIILSHPDPIISLGAILGAELYGSHPAVVVASAADRGIVVSGDLVTIEEDGWITVDRVSETMRSADSRPLLPPNSR